MNVFQQFGVFDPLVFQHEGVAGVVAQTLPALSQSSVGEVCKPLFQPNVYQRDVFGGCEEITPSVSGAIDQTLPALTQRARATSGQVIEVSFGAQPISEKVKVHGTIQSVLPALIQDVEANVTDDELVLLMI